jgi:hypothetical protein
VKSFPREFEALLTKTGRRVLAGRHPEFSGVLAKGTSRFFGAEGLLDVKKSQGLAQLLEHALGDRMAPMEQPIPRSATWGMKHAYKEKLPKTVMVRTAMLDEEKSPARERAEEIGLIAMLRSKSFHAFAEALSGYPLRRQWGLQTLCYWPHDYSGPHNDHHPDEPLGCDGYTDLHLTFSTAAVDHQWLVYERAGHLQDIRSVATVGGVTCYRLPFWHYTTPLVARRGQEREARRWVLLGTFLDRWS